MKMDKPLNLITVIEEMCTYTQNQYKDLDALNQINIQTTNHYLEGSNND